MNDWLGKTIAALITAAVMAIATMAWNSRDILFDIQTNIAVIKEVQTNAARRAAAQIRETGNLRAQIREETRQLEERVRQLELRQTRPPQHP